MKLEPMKALNDQLRVARDRGRPADPGAVPRHLLRPASTACEMFLLKEFFEILEKAIDRCREAGVVAYQIVLKNS